MGSEEVKLIGAWYSPFVYRIKWALKMKGVEYEYIEEDLQNKSPLLLSCNPIYKKVPVLIHGGKPIAESVIILEYIEDTWKQNPLLPEDPYERALVRFWVKFAEDQFTLGLRGALLSKGEQQDKDVKQALGALEILEGELKHKKFFGGETIGFVDIVLGFIPIWLKPIEEAASFNLFDPHKFPSINKWMENFMEVPFINDNLPPSNTLVAYFHKMHQMGLAYISN